MSTPYWGNLPSPHVSTRTHHQRGSSGEYASRAPGRQPPDPAAPVASEPRPNRTSTQTNNSEAYTEATSSPYATPRNSYQGSGLGPRPASQSMYPPDIIEKRRRRASKNREEEAAYVVSGALPATADVPKASPVGYRHPYGNGGLPYTLPKADQDPQPDIPSPGVVDPDFYKPLNAVDRTKRASQASSRRASSGSTAAARNNSTREAVHGHRKSSLGNEVDRRLFADMRSPLQRLELTLDSITKEERRARVEAAERNARDRALSRGGTDKDGSHTPTVRFRDQDTESESESPQLQNHPEPVSARSVTVPQGVAKAEESQRKTQRQVPHQKKNPNPKSFGDIDAQEDGPMQRNLSFRERAARNDIKLPNGGSDIDSPTTLPPTTPTSGGFSLTRQGSNKLKKGPPGDPSYHRRIDADRNHGQSASGQSRGAPRSLGPAQGPGTAAVSAPVGPPTKAAGGSMRSRAPPPLNTAVAVSRPPPQQIIPGHDGGYDDGDDDDLESPITTGNSVHTAKQEQGLASARGPPASSFPFASDPPQQSSPLRVKFDADTAAGPGYPGDHDDDSHHGHHISEFFHRHDYKPGQGLYNPPKYLDEWRKGTVGTLSGTLLELSDVVTPTVDKGQTWWETPPSQRRGSISSRPRKAEAFDGEYDENNAPTRFKPPLYLKCGPLLRYCGMRTERITGRSARNGPAIEREFWRGTVMIVTTDQESSYDIAPTLRLFVQPIENLPPPPAEVRGEVPPEYVDPVAGLPKLGRRGETLYVRPVDHLDEGRDLSRDPSDKGLFERTRSPPDIELAEGCTDAPGSFADRKKRAPLDGEKMGKYKDIRGYRLHAERGYTFWRFSIEVELRDKEQRIAYRINRGPATGFWVPAKGQSMNIMLHSCNGFSLSVNPNEMSGPDPLWRDVLNNHQSRPFHVMLGNGDQLYCDAVMRETRHFQEWLMIRNPVHKQHAPFSPKMQDELEEFYLERYCMWFSQGLFSLANSQIPMVNIYDDHDIIDGFGSYPHHFMSSPVFSGLGNVAFKYYMLFQHQSIADETEESEPSWALGLAPGPYIHEQSRSLFMFLGSKIALLAVDARTERTRDQVVKEDTWDKLIERCYNEIVKGKTEHLLVMLGVPIAYPRLVWLENILTSRLLDPVKALGKAGMFSNVFNKFDGGVEVLDDLDDHWAAKNHKDERRIIIEDLQDLAADRSVRVTILSGDVHLAAVGQFYSNPKLGLPKHKDFRYMPNVISSAIVNTPPPDLMADVLNKRNKVHHLDKDTDEDMIPMFGHGVEGKPRNNKRLLPHRNWCSIREYTPGQTPPSTPPESLYEEQAAANPPAAQGGGGFIHRGISRRLSKRNRGPAHRADVIDSRPPNSSKAPGGLFRTLSSRGRRSDSDVPAGEKRPGTGRRTLSLTRGDFSLFRRGSKSREKTKPDDGGINGTWGDDSEPEDGRYENSSDRSGGGGFLGAIGLRGGGGSYEEFSEGDDSYFTARAPSNTASTSRPGPSAAKAARLLGEEAPAASYGRGLDGQLRGYGVTTTVTGPAQQQQQQAAVDASFRPKPVLRTPTSASMKQGRGLKRVNTHEVNIQGGLDICLNVEVSAKDPAGITVPYRLLVPKLWYDAAEGQDVEMPARNVNGVKRLLSLSRAKSQYDDGARAKGAGRGFERQQGYDQVQDQRLPMMAPRANGPGGGREIDPAPGTAF